MGYPATVKHVLNNWTTLEGRASRTEFWSWLGTLFAIGVVCQTAVYYLGSGIATTIISWSFLVFWLCTTVAVAVRRLHDSRRTGWWFLATFVPYLGLLVLIFYFMPSDPDPNKYGPPTSAKALPDVQPEY